jgi:DNA-binding MarR family transcriptional regulator
VASLERLSQVLGVLLRKEALERGLSPIQALFLVHLLFHGPELRRAGRLAEEFGLTAATVSDAVGSLQKKGLVDRDPWAGDGRVAILRLTSAGEEAARGIATWANAVEVASVPPRRRRRRS